MAGLPWQLSAALTSRFAMSAFQACRDKDRELLSKSMKTAVATAT